MTIEKAPIGGKVALFNGLKGIAEVGTVVGHVRKETPRVGWLEYAIKLENGTFKQEHFVDVFQKSDFVDGEPKVEYVFIFENHCKSKGVDPKVVLASIKETYNQL